MFALEQGLSLKGRAPEITALLEALMGKLEKDKAVVQLGRDQEDAVYCENFALTVFNRADRVDRAGRADKATAMTFYAASYFMEVLRHFGEPPSDIQQKQKYAAWRAAEISKAVKEGRQPEAPPAAGQAALDDEAALLDELAKLEMAGSPSSAAAMGPAAPHAPPPPPPAASSGVPAGSFSGLLPPPPPEAPGSPELRLPSPPKQRPMEAQPSGEVWQPPPLQRFQTFQKVLVLLEGAPGPTHGTVAKVEEGPDPDLPTYLVALPDRIAPISDTTCLAPDLATGEAVQYSAPSGGSMEATVAEMDLGHWPPSYLVRLADGNYVDTTSDRLHQLAVHRPSSQGAGLDSLAAPAPPPPPPATAAGPGLHGPHAGAMYPPPATGVAPPPPASSPQAARPAAPPPAAAPVALPAPVPGFQPGLREVTDAAKLTKSATSALQFEDTTTAVRLLTEALALLTGLPPPGRK
ncbi:vacuolar sorting-associated VTA1-like protein [Micractinium conductrix]|uniref:Vacuolar sorting-associated VTA1-like protein n=1 Tax=Micractinium conductrix TaxID=554055 RepID=A0A2P6V364_9CHLO|nr:vacuolar sorting-associated VTA1-like protein [Micractinium conductrix]|eukprot:PSC68533.1 vacuolar sorting-associated VTA1-like protein [Micractinium conductrix]